MLTGVQMARALAHVPAPAPAVRVPGMLTAAQAEAVLAHAADEEADAPPQGPLRHAHRRHFRLESARRHARAGEFTWGLDALDGTGTGKRFLNGTARGAWRALGAWRDGFPGMYEVIGEGPVRGYLDIEKDGEFTGAESEALAKWVYSLVLEYLARAFPDTAHDLVMLSACSARKFSLHVITSLVLDGRLSAQALALEVNAYLNAHAHNAPRDMVDLGVYGRNRLFRTVGSDKRANRRGDPRPLRIVDVNATLGEDFLSPVASWPGTTLDTFLRTLVSVPLAMTAHTEPRTALSIAAPAGCHVPQQRARSPPRDDMAPAGRFYTPPHAPARTPEVRDIPTRPATRARATTRARSMIDADEEVARADGVIALARNLPHACAVYCTRCESTYDRSQMHGLWRVLYGQGTPSARVCRVDGRVPFIYCFACCARRSIIDVVDVEGFVPLPHEIISPPADATDRRINGDGRNDASLHARYRLCVVDAPPGCGKTHLVRAYLARRLDARVLVITFRRALAEYLATHLDVTCYKVDGFWYDRNGNPLPAEHRNFSRCVVCLDSLGKIPPLDGLAYDVVILDECVFTLFHLVSGHMKSERAGLVERALRHHISRAGRTIILQHRIPAGVIDLFADWVRPGADESDIIDVAIDRQTHITDHFPTQLPVILRWKYTGPVVLHPTKLLKSKTALEQAAVGTYIANYDTTLGRSSLPMVIFTTRATHAAALHGLLTCAALAAFGPRDGDDAETAALRTAAAAQATSRIKYVTGPTQENAWARAFMADPNAHADQCDVLIVTSVFQAGHSFDTHFRQSMFFLFRGVLSYREEMQLISRLRYLTRTDMAPYRFGWIERGHPNAYIANVDRIQFTIDTLTDIYELTQSVRTMQRILCLRKAELADTANRHRYLHVLEYRKANVELLLDCEPEGPVPSEEWVKRTMSAVTDVRKTAGGDVYVREVCVIGHVANHVTDAPPPLPVLDPRNPDPLALVAAIATAEFVQTARTVAQYLHSAPKWGPPGMDPFERGRLFAVLLHGSIDMRRPLDVQLAPHYLLRDLLFYLAHRYYGGTAWPRMDAARGGVKLTGAIQNAHPKPVALLLEAYGCGARAGLPPVPFSEDAWGENSVTRGQVTRMLSESKVAAALEAMYDQDPAHMAQNMRDGQKLSNRWSGTHLRKFGLYAKFGHNIKWDVPKISLSLSAARMLISDDDWVGLERLMSAGVERKMQARLVAAGVKLAALTRPLPLPLPQPVHTRAPSPAAVQVPEQAPASSPAAPSPVHTLSPAHPPRPDENVDEDELMNRLLGVQRAWISRQRGRQKRARTHTNTSEDEFDSDTDSDYSEPI